MQTKKALIFGTTGLVGGYLLDLLLTDQRYDKVVAFSRRPLQRKDPKLESVVTDFVDPLYETYISGEDIFCCLGTTMKVAGSKEAFQFVDLELPLHIASIGIKSGTSRFLVVSSMGANPDSPFFYNRIKGEMEKGIQDYKFPSTVIVRPSMILGKRDQIRRLEEIGKYIFKLFGFIFVGKLRKYRAIQAIDIARAMVVLANREAEKVVYNSDEIFRIGKNRLQ